MDLSGKRRKISRTIDVKNLIYYNCKHSVTEYGDNFRKYWTASMKNGRASEKSGRQDCS